MKTLEPVMRAMTNLNIGAMLGMAAWVLWSGHQVVSGAWQVPAPARPHPHPAAPAATRAVDLPCCFVPAEAPGRVPGRLQARNHDARHLARVGEAATP